LPLRVTRARLMAAIDSAVEHGARVQRDRDLGQADLFGVTAEDESVGGAAVPLPEAVPWTETELLTAEKEALGLFWTGHPIDAHAADLKEFGARTIADLVAPEEPPVDPELGDIGTALDPAYRRPARSGEEVSVGGIISATRLLKTRKGDPMAVCTLEDRHGGVEIVVFPETFKTARPLVENGAMVVVRGKLERDDETVRVLATEMVGMGTVRERLAREMAITVAVPPHGRETFEALADLFAHHRGDKPVTFQLLVKDQGRQLRVRAQVSAQIRVKPTSALVQEVEKICGAGAVALR